MTTSEEPLPKVGDNSFTEREGVLAVASITNRARLLWREVLMHDVGIDGQIEEVSPSGSATGRLVLVQVKSGPSYWKSATEAHVTFRPSERHINYWSRAPLPVILVLHDEASQRTVWADARSQLRAGKQEIVIPIAQRFAESSLHQIFSNHGPAPSPTSPDHVIREMLSNTTGNPSFPLDYLDIFTLGAFQHQRSLLISMSLIWTAGQGILGLTAPGVGWSLGPDDYEFVLGYVTYLSARDLVRIDYDSFMEMWDELQVVPDVVAPLTPRGRAVLARIRSLDDSLEVRVVQDMYFVGFEEWDVLRHLPPLLNFKERISRNPPWGNPSAH